MEHNWLTRLEVSNGQSEQCGFPVDSVTGEQKASYGEEKEQSNGRESGCRVGRKWGYTADKSLGTDCGAERAETLAYTNAAQAVTAVQGSYPTFASDAAAHAAVDSLAAADENGISEASSNGVSSQHSELYGTGSLPSTLKVLNLR